jgi:Ni,Fe-hydrogenase III small subunit/NAD-dependent dihydropyrimidine dehydrogenase PreA subunit
MFRLAKILWNNRKQYIPDPTTAKLSPPFRGMPVVNDHPCAEECRACAEACPTDAVALDPVALDLGKCVFCGECQAVCPVEKIVFTPDYRTYSNHRDGLWVSEKGANGINPEKTRSEIVSMFSRSLRLRQVSAGGCNACENELNATLNPNFDLARYGIDFVASPRHADGLVLTGPISQNMAEALDIVYEAMPEPKMIIAVGACAISGGVFEPSSQTERSFLERYTPDLYIPGCPPHPLTFINGILELLRRRKT